MLPNFIQLKRSHVRPLKFAPQISPNLLIKVFQRDCSYRNVFSFTTGMKRDCYKLRILILSLPKKCGCFYKTHKLVKTNSHFFYIVFYSVPLELAKYTVKGYQENAFYSFLLFNLSWILRAECSHGEIAFINHK